VKVASHRLLAAALILWPALASAQRVQSPRPGGAGPVLPPHVAAQLWPERELSPVEQELKQHVTVLGDSLTRIDAMGSMIERQSRSGASAGIVRSSARTLRDDCARAGRTSAPVVSFAATLSTNDAKWGEPAVRGWRSGLAALTQQLTACEEALQGLSERATAEDVERLQRVSQRTGQALSDYRRTEQALIRTLKIEISPIKRSR
jgi:hypothetical protein